MNDKYLQYDITQLAQDEAFIRWVRQPESAQSADWQAWLEEHPAQKPKVEAARTLVLGLRFQEADIDAARKEALWERIDSATRERTHTRSRRLSLRWVSYAAAAVLLLLVGFFFWSDASGRLMAEAYTGKTLAVELPDGSQATLNAESRLQYRSPLWSGRRVVKLEGEAFFEVEKGEPFIVETANGTVEVLGTSFNVDSYGNSFNVSCYTGKVKVSTAGESIVLEPGQAAIRKNGRLQPQGFDAKEQQDWRNGLFEYKNTPLEEVFAEMERQFAVDINAPDSILSREYTGFYNNNNLDSALYLVTWPMNLRVEQQGKKITIAPIE